MFQSVCSKSIDMLDHLKSHPGAVENTETSVHLFSGSGPLQKEHPF